MITSIYHQEYTMQCTQVNKYLLKQVSINSIFVHVAAYTLLIKLQLLTYLWLLVSNRYVTLNFIEIYQSICSIYMIYLDQINVINIFSTVSPCTVKSHSVKICCTQSSYHICSDKLKLNYCGMDGLCMRTLIDSLEYVVDLFRPIFCQG